MPWAGAFNSINSINSINPTNSTNSINSTNSTNSINSANLSVVLAFCLRRVLFCCPLPGIGTQAKPSYSPPGPGANIPEVPQKNQGLLEPRA